MSRHGRGWLSGLVVAVKRYYGFGCSGVTVAPRVSAGLHRCISDDWYADLPTVELPACVVDRPQRTAVREAVTDRRERYWQETPLFMAVVEALGMNDLLGAVA